jgi:hypothetical protein
MQPQAASPRRTRSGETAVDSARRTGTIADLMATEMLRINADNGQCTSADLRAAGFTAGDIVTFHEEAKAIANRRFVRQTDTGRRAA